MIKYDQNMGIVLLILIFYVMKFNIYFIKKYL